MKAWLKENWSTLGYMCLGLLVIYYLREIAATLGSVDSSIYHLKP